MWKLKQAQFTDVKHWEIIVAKLSAAGLSWACSSEISATGHVLYTADAYRKDGKRFTVIAGDRLAAFLELERLIRESLCFPNAKSFGPRTAED